MSWMSRNSSGRGRRSRSPLACRSCWALCDTNWNISGAITRRCRDLSLGERNSVAPAFMHSVHRHLLPVAARRDNERNIEPPLLHASQRIARRKLRHGEIR